MNEARHRMMDGAARCARCGVAHVTMLRRPEIARRCRPGRKFRRIAEVRAKLDEGGRELIDFILKVNLAVMDMPKEIGWGAPTGGWL